MGHTPRDQQAQDMKRHTTTRVDGPGTYVGFWPIIDPTVPTMDLVTEARNELPGCAARAGARITGPPSWRIAQGSAIPGAGAYETVLAVSAAAESIPRLADYLARVNAQAMALRADETRVSA